LIKNKSIPLSYFAFKYKDLNESKGEPNTAFIQLSGAIYSGESISGVGLDEGVIGSKSVTEILKEIEGKNGIKSVILRIDSPGGVYEPSSEIRNGLQKLKEKGKKVIVSMSGVCASGCYYIATGADYILSGENSLTGSIGVFGGKVNLSGMWDKLGINWENIKRGDNAGIFSLNRSFSESEKQVFMKSLNNVYDDFSFKVARSRGIENIDEVARGRVLPAQKLLNLI
jgi:protease-4